MTAGDVAGADLRSGTGARSRTTFVLEDHRKLRRAPSPRAVRPGPGASTRPWSANVVERIFRVDNPDPKPGLARILREEQRRAGLRLRDLARDSWEGWRSYGCTRDDLLRPGRRTGRR